MTGYCECEQPLTRNGIVICLKCGKIIASKKAKKYKRLLDFHEHELQLLNKAEQLGEEGVEKRLKELEDTAKEIDELKEIRKILDEGKAFQELSIPELKRRKLEEIENCKIILKELV